uniref:Cytochrome b5 domain-containing protein 1 n=1 Tax=Albugo laibachii Nc14 TaxID=890382 RepID=F0WTC3_9STRA|nr:cytochrome b5like protein putative [Albugo laibachii Nc14]|eukprot:CCA24613.1 cytochrome b5like protein putative [Albugo laibachii Nc14]
MRYFTPRQVAEHNTAEDCWITLFHHVYDISELIQASPGALTQPLVLHAGKDISHWFDPKTRDIHTCMDPFTNSKTLFYPYGRFLHVESPVDSVPWWKRKTFIIGSLTKNPRSIGIINTLTQQQHELEICWEETIEEIQARFLKYNAHARSYTWKHLLDDVFVPLRMSETLEQNGIVDESLVLERLGLDERTYKPILLLYFNDDLTVQ